uniref:Uncharacterized protein n=1 Tax=Rangifer tarandus platyrhynchus TaxID=3082113 RepID=A0ACB0F685_RANTA|nr:unnamed protein product [Rangifer tarandus platyrhynchus]
MVQAPGSGLSDPGPERDSKEGLGQGLERGWACSGSLVWRRRVCAWPDARGPQLGLWALLRVVTGGSRELLSPEIKGASGHKCPAGHGTWELRPVGSRTTARVGTGGAQPCPAPALKARSAPWRDVAAELAAAMLRMGAHPSPSETLPRRPGFGLQPLDVSSRQAEDAHRAQSPLPWGQSSWLRDPDLGLEPGDGAGDSVDTSGCGGPPGLREARPAQTVGPTLREAPFHPGAAGVGNGEWGEADLLPLQAHLPPGQELHQLPQWPLRPSGPQLQAKQWTVVALRQLSPEWEPWPGHVAGRPHTLRSPRLPSHLLP